MNLNWNIFKGVLYVCAAVLYLLIFRKSGKHLNEEKRKDGYFDSEELKKASDFHDDFMFWGGRIGAALIILRGLYLIYSELFT